MKLGSISDNSRDGCPVLVDRCLRYMVPVNNVIDNWQLAIENWSAVSPKLEKIYEKLDKGLAQGASPYDRSKLSAPFPRAYQWLDGSAYVNPVELLPTDRMRLEVYHERTQNLCSTHLVLNFGD